MLCSAAKQNGIKLLYDDIAIDNPAVTMFLKNGFIEEYRTSEIIMLKKELLNLPDFYKRAILHIGKNILGLPIYVLVQRS